MKENLVNILRFFFFNNSEMYLMDMENALKNLSYSNFQDEMMMSL